MKSNNSHRRVKLFLGGILVLLAFVLASVSSAAEPKKVAILPFVINAPERMDYLREGVRDMLASRLSWEDKVVVLDNSQVNQVREKVSGTIDEPKALEMGKQLGADVVLWGSINVLGTTVSLDLNLVNIALRQPVRKFYAQAKNIDEVIIRVGELSEMINEKVFDRPRPAPAAGPKPETVITKTPAPPSEEASSSKPTISLKDYTINPLAPESIIRSGGFNKVGMWQSSTLPFAIVDMAFGDIDGDGKIETVLISKNKVFIYRFSDNRFLSLKEIPGGMWDNYISVDVADILGTGIPQIFVTNFRGGEPQSFILSWSKGDYKVQASDIPYYLRVHRLPNRGLVLLGQKTYGDQLFDTKIEILSWKGGKLVSAGRLNIPDGLTVYNFALLEDRADGSQEILYLSSPSNRLMIATEKGKAIYSSPDPFGGTITAVRRSEVNSLPGHLPERNEVFIPSRILVTSALNPGKREIIINKNKGSVFNIIAGYKGYTSGEILSLSWDKGILKENWRTPVIDYYISNYGIADFKNNGQNQLVVGVVQAVGITLISDARSVLFSYDFGPAKPGSQ